MSRIGSRIRVRAAAILIAVMVFQIAGVSVALAAAPVVKSSTIAPGAEGVSVSPELWLEFEDPIALYEEAGSITWTPASGEVVPGYANVWESVYLIVGPSFSPIQYGMGYTLNIPLNMVLDNATDDPMSSDFTLAFTTEADTTGPLFYSAYARADKLRVTYYDSESPMDPASVPAPTDFSVTVSGSPVAVTNVAAQASGASVVYILTLAAPVTFETLSSDIVFRYWPNPEATPIDPIQNAVGLPAVASGPREVQNATPEDLTPPAFLFAIVPEGSSDMIQAVFSKSLVGSGSGGFVVTVNGTPAALSSVGSGDPGIVELTLASAITNQDMIALAYDGTGSAQDPFANLLLPFPPQPVANYGLGYTRPTAQIFPTTVRSTTSPMTFVMTGADFGSPEDAFVLITNLSYSGSTAINSYESEKIVFTIPGGLNPLIPTEYSAEVGKQFETSSGGLVNMPVAEATFTVRPDADPIQISTPVLSLIENLPEVQLSWAPVQVYGGSADDVLYRLYRYLNPKSEAEDPEGDYWTDSEILAEVAAGPYTDDLTVIGEVYKQVKYDLEAAYQGWSPFAYLDDHVYVDLGGGGGSDPVPVVGVTLSQPSLTLTMGQPAVQLVATVLPPSATNRAVTWESSKPSVAAVDQSGKVSAVSPGSCTITVRTVDGGFTANCDVMAQAPGGGDAISFVWIDDDADHVYYAGDDISFKVTGLDALPNGTPVRVALGLLGEEGFDRPVATLTGMLSGGPYYYLPLTVSNGEIVIEGEMASGLGLGVLGCQIGTSSDGGVTWTALAPGMPVDPAGDRNLALLEVNVPDSTILVTPALKTIQNLYNTEIPVKFTKMLDMGHGLKEFGSIQFAPGLSLIDGKDEFGSLEDLVTMMGAINLVTGEIQYVMGVDTAALAFLSQKGATVSIGDLPFGFANIIITNLGDEDGRADNIKVENGVLTFDVNHFSTYLVDGAVPPAWPQGSSLAATSVQTTTLTLGWSEATDNVAVTQYRVYQGNTLIQTVGAETRTFAVSDLTPGTEYTFKVEAGDAADSWSSSGPSVTATTSQLPDTTVPTWPDGSSLKTVSTVGQTSLQLTWTAASDNVGVTQYRVYKGDTLLGTKPASTSTYSVTGLTAGTQYTFKTEAGDAAGNWSATGPSLAVKTAAQQQLPDAQDDEPPTPPAPPTPPPPGPGVGEGTADVSAGALTTRATNSDGSETVNVTVNQDTMNTALANPAVTEVIVRVLEAAEGMSATVPAASFTAMAERQATLVVQTGGANLSIPAQAVNTPALSQALNAPADQIQVRVSVQEVPAGAADDLRSRIAIFDENLRPIGSILELHMEATAGDRSVSIDSFGGSEVTGEIPFTPASVQGMDVQKLCVYRFNEVTGTWEPVRSRVDAASGRVIFYTDHFSKYTIMSYEKTFADLAGHWAKEDVELLASRWVLNGYTATTFAPERSVTRAEFAAMVVRALGFAEVKPAGASFNDVTSGAWYFGVVEAAAKADIVGGVGEGRFQPDRTITREEMAVIVMRALAAAGKMVELAGGEQEHFLNGFPDNGDIQAWSAPYLAGAIKSGVVEGVNGAILPAAQATRAQAATMVKRLMSLAGLL